MPHIQVKSLLVGFRKSATLIATRLGFCAANLLEVESLRVESFVAS